MSPATYVSMARDEVPQTLIVFSSPSKRLPETMNVLPSATRFSSGSAARATTFCSAGKSEAHQPDVEIWSAVRKDETKSPIVGISQSTTMTTTEI